MHELKREEETNEVKGKPIERQANNQTDSRYMYKLHTVYIKKILS